MMTTDDHESDGGGGNDDYGENKDEHADSQP